MTAAGVAAPASVRRPGGPLHEMLGHAYLEMIPTRKAAAQVRHLPRGAWVGVSCSPTAGVEPTLGLVGYMSEQRPDLKPVPHIAARVVRDRAHLADIIARLSAAGVRAVFVPAGDSKEPAGDYTGALDLLRDIAELGHPFRHVGVAAHPEGHPLLDRRELLHLLLEKQPFATYFVTQVCFDPDAIGSWLRDIRRAGVTLHAWPGLSGVLEIPKLLALSLRIGVGRSARMLKRQKGLALSLLNGPRYRPDALLEGLVPYVTDPAMGVYGFHLFSFNNVRATECWRNDTLERLGEMENRTI